MFTPPPPSVLTVLPFPLVSHTLVCMYLIFIGMCGVVVEVQIGVMKVHGSNLGDCIIGIIYQPFFSKYLSQLVVILS